MRYQDFWRQSLPEYVLPRDEMLQAIGDQQQFDAEALKAYQDRVAGIYGAYEPEMLQLKTLEMLLPTIDQEDGERHLVSFGSGPGVCEIWMLGQDFLDACTLVDLSAEMLKRAEGIAALAGIPRSRLHTICTDCGTKGILPEPVDMGISINALHWSRNWQEWIKNLCESVKVGGLVILSCTLEHPQTNIGEQTLLREVQQYVNIKQHDYLIPATRIGRSQIAQIKRYYVIGRRKKR